MRLAVAAAAGCWLGWAIGCAPETSAARPPAPAAASPDPVPQASRDSLPDDLRRPRHPTETFLGRVSKAPRNPVLDGRRRPPRPTETFLDRASKEPRNPVLDGLRWLARHQAPDGHWDCDGFMAECGKQLPGTCGGPGYAEYDAGSTGLALLAFFGAGYTHHSRDAYDGICFGDVVKKGLQWLIAHQEPDGCVGGKSCGKYMYNHAIAALALCEAYGLTGSALLKEPAQKGVDFIVAAQNPGKGWRYTARSGDNDTSVTGWCVMALKSAEISDLRLPRSAYDGAKAWLDEAMDDDCRVGYVSRRSRSGTTVRGPSDLFAEHETMTAVAVMCRIFMRENWNTPRLKGGADLLMQDLPEWEGHKIDFYYWYFADLALFQVDHFHGPRWKTWHTKKKDALEAHQKQAADDCSLGSWDPIDRWGGAGGRVYSTAINTLGLEYYDHHPNIRAVEQKK